MAVTVKDIKQGNCWFDSHSKISNFYKLKHNNNNNNNLFIYKAHFPNAQMRLYKGCHNKTIIFQWNLNLMLSFLQLRF
jgi:hypothetical protein